MLSRSSVKVTSTKAAGEGQVDSFVSALIAKYENGGQEYKGTLYLDVSVAIGE